MKKGLDILSGKKNPGKENYWGRQRGPSGSLRKKRHRVEKTGREAKGSSLDNCYDGPKPINTGIPERSAIGG